MSGWKLDFEPQAETDLASVDKPRRQRVLDKLSWFVKSLNQVGLEKLTGEFSSFYKLRVGDWRVLYKLDRPNSTVVVCHINNRNQIYKKK